ncbi:MAG: NAD-dependent epimerase/dehydratase family protein, partial [Bdellovibrionota bacterium]
MKILVTGATGFIGKTLCKELLDHGHQLIVLSRSEKKAKSVFGNSVEVVEGDLLNTVPNLIGRKIDAVVHLAGDSIASGRWTPNKKEAIRKSRILGTENLVTALNALGGSGPSVLISANAVGYYGDRGDEILSESAKAGEGFLAEVCRDWERAVISRSAGRRVVIFRMGMVLRKEGGVLI